MRSGQPGFLKRLAVVFLAVLFSAVALGQGDWTLGRYTLLTGEPSPPLRVNLARAGGLGSYSFVSSVGGVAFSAVASPAPALAGKAVTLRYDARAADGERLEIVTGDITLRGDVADWMLVPIARYADSPYDSCVSLFGPNTTDTVYDIVYHPELQNTLLGSRILQADILLFDLSQTWQLPALGGMPVLGFGETAPGRLDVAGTNRIQTAMTGGAFQSWVMTDQGEEVVFASDAGRLRLTGLPYYYFWSSNVEEVIRQQKDLAARAQQARQAGRVAEHNTIVERINAMEPQVTHVSNLTARMKESRDSLRQFNTPVYTAAMQTMRYAALFRYVKRQSPGTWAAFLGQLRAVRLEPQVRTPTRWAP